jgi:hypothetical protein
MIMAWKAEKGWKQVSQVQKVGCAVQTYCSQSISLMALPRV